MTGVQTCALPIYYRGYGQSEGRPSREGLYEDSVAALQYVKGRGDLEQDRLFVLGQSIGGANALAALATYRSVSAGRDRTLLLGLRAALVVVLALCLLRPSLILKAAVPQQNFLGILIDDSRSMTIASVSLRRSASTAVSLLWSRQIVTLCAASCG